MDMDQNSSMQPRKNSSFRIYIAIGLIVLIIIIIIIIFASSDTTSSDTTSSDTVPSKKYKYGTYLSAKKCPPGFKQYIGGMLQLRGSKSPFLRGEGTYGADHIWHHPNLCMGEPNEQNIKDLYGFTSNKDASVSKGGIIMPTNPEYPIKYLKGPKYGNEWLVYQPYITNNYDDMDILSTKPGDKRNIAGLIVPKSVTPPFVKGSGYNNGWKWAHPYI